MSRVTSSSSTSVVGIRDTAGNDLTSTAGSLNVNVVTVTPSGSPVVEYQQATGVAMGSTATVFSYTIPVGTSLTLDRILVSSDSVSVLDVQFNNVLNARKRLTYLTWNDQFDYEGFVLSAGDNIKVLCTNNSLESVAEFNVTLIGVSV